MISVVGTTPTGRLRPAADAPAAGELVEPIVTVRKLVVEQILSAPSAVPHEYRQDSDEWVVVLAGAAVLDVGGERLELGPGDWAFLPAGVRHAVVETGENTSWLAVHLQPD
jgi:cupin 2 domain-containing protein